MGGALSGKRQTSKGTSEVGDAAALSPEGDSAAAAGPLEAAQRGPPQRVAGCSLGEEEFANAMRDLRGGCSDIALSSCEVEDEGARQLAEALEHNASVSSLNLGVNSLTDDGIVALSRTLATTKIKKLSLERNGLTPVGIAALAGRGMPRSLEELRLGRNTVCGEGAVALAAALQRGDVPEFRVLGLGFAKLQADGARTLGTVLDRLKVLEIPGNHIGGEGAAGLAEGLLRTTSTLQVLRLESNLVGDTGAKAFSDSLRQNCCLQTLELRRNSITDTGAQELAASLANNKSLTDLDLFDNSISDVGANAFLEMLRKSRTCVLKKLNLDINDVSQQMMARVIADLK
eukprot:TRINITY_DN123791_c0_g1_i1.p2 TRINITY_DN123791_c0_g1~~TRINITY_DN123791_c0_g1_i1.p2  ORF type:complete len:345 (-),score=95.74 TRINITY_DN123791_c0_g1_i1:37-1071(-)